MDTRSLENARSILGTLHSECSMAAIALHGTRKRGSTAFEQAIQRIAVLTRLLEEIAAQLTETHQQLHLGINEVVPLRSRDGTNGEHYDAGDRS